MKQGSTKKYLFIFLKGIGKALGAILTFLLCYLIIAFIFSSITVSAEEHAKDEIAIYILTNGVHTEIVLPAITEQMDWTSQLPYEHTKAADNRYHYIAMGWGDKRFYLETPTWADLKFSTAFNASFGLSSSAIHITYYKELVESESCKRILISKEQYERLVAFISESFQKNNTGNFIPIITDANYGNYDAFYEAHGSYSLFKTCNSWANDALKSSGQKACLWTAFDTGIFKKYE